MWAKQQGKFEVLRHVKEGLARHPQIFDVLGGRENPDDPALEQELLGKALDGSRGVGDNPGRTPTPQQTAKILDNKTHRANTPSLLYITTGLGGTQAVTSDDDDYPYPTEYPIGKTSSEVIASGVTFSSVQRGWLNDLQAGILCDVLELPQPPMLFHGPYDPEVVMPLRNGSSMWPGANHVREGFVMRPASVEPEKVIPRVGRPVMKALRKRR